MRQWSIRVLMISAVLLCWTQALALDGYRDRRGIFYGFGLGGGQTKVDVSGSKGRLGHNLRFRIGGGVNKTLTLDAEIGLHSASYTESTVDMERTISTFGIGGNSFINDGLYLRLAFGMAEFTQDSDISSDTETGLFVGGGVGYEFFANADLAIGLGVDFQHQMYDDLNISALNLGITANWY